VLSQPGLEKLNQSEKLEKQSLIADLEPLSPSDEPDETNQAAETGKSREIGGYKGAEPTRFGDWEKNGRCIDF
jgi:hypothetical protein